MKEGMGTTAYAPGGDLSDEHTYEEAPLSVQQEANLF